MRSNISATDSATANLPVLNRKGEVVAYTVLDAPDARRFGHLTWTLSRGYPRATIAPYQRAYLHRLILGLDDGDRRWGDHRNRDPLDNRRANLRIVSPAGNAQNRPSIGASPFRGVSRHPCGRYHANVMLAGTPNRLGSFLDGRIAALVADRFRRDHMPYATLDPALTSSAVAHLIGALDLTCTVCGTATPTRDARNWLVAADGPQCFECNDAVLPKRGPKFKPPRPCSNCSRATTRLSRGRCDTCYAYFRRNGFDRAT